MIPFALWVHAMFDPDTVALIRRAPVLADLDLAALPQRLTDAYANIVAARIRTRRTPTASEGLPEAVGHTVAEMQRLAFAMEGLLSAVPEREDRAAAAFVAGTAHHVALLAERTTASGPRPSTLEPDGIAPEVSATLLFLIAEATADAAEMSRAFSIQSDDTVEEALLEALQRLADGRLRELLEADVPSPDVFLQTNPTDQAVRSLYHMVLRGVRTLAEVMLGRATTAGASTAAGAQSLFEQVKSLSLQPLPDLSIAPDTVASNLFPGPLHMASLLSAVSRDLTPAALASLPPPMDVDPDAWGQTMRHMADRRPYLWRNHRQAIDQGYLERGTSSVVSFPTGAGKSALAEMKTAVALLKGEPAVFLAPTHALVDQTATTLRKAFPRAKVRGERAVESSMAVDGDELPDISVLTPERCLSLLNFGPEAFENVGLLVFDECHLLHQGDLDNSRRAVDAMLCVLRFAAVAPKADFLFLSAMMMNTRQIAAWIEALNERPCLALELTWKPTRQVRGCVVYRTEEISTLRRELLRGRASTNAASPPAALKRTLQAHPLGLVCLRQTWQSTKREDYALVPLLEEPILLGTGVRNGRWYLTPNGNKVAAAVAVAAAPQGLKTLVFTQTVVAANATARQVTTRLGRADCVLTREEKRLYETAREEAGDDVHLYLEVNERRSVESSALAHHGLLLPAERRLHESLYKRRNGIDVLVATSTLAQGMNLPSEIVIIASDSRFDVEAGQFQQLEAYELLNAAGRAGRAGENSYGFVLVIPSRVVHFDNATSEIEQHWGRLQAIFSRSDACVRIDDPLVGVLDEIHAASGPLSEIAEYVIWRLPRGGLTETDDADDADGAARVFLARSFGAFVARARNEVAWVNSRIEAAVAARRMHASGTADVTWAEELAVAAGLPVGVVGALGEWLGTRGVRAEASVCDWRDTVLSWLEERPELVASLLRADGLGALLGSKDRQIEDESSRGRAALRMLKKLSREWMAGSTLAKMEAEFGTPTEKLGKCESARAFVLRVVPSLAYLCGVASEVFRAAVAEEDLVGEGLINLEVLRSCVHGGFDRAEMLALSWIRGPEASRVAVHRDFGRLSGFLDGRPEFEDVRGLRRRVQRAVDASAQGAG